MMTETPGIPNASNPPAEPIAPAETSSPTPEPVAAAQDQNPQPPAPSGPTWQEQAVALYEKGKSVAAISKILQQTPKGLRSLLIEKGVTLREPRWYGDALSFYRQGLSISEISTKIGEPGNKVRGALRTLGEAVARPKLDSKEWLPKAVKLFEKGKTVDEISEKLGVSPRVLKKALKKKRGLDPSTVKAIVQKYEEGATLREVGAFYHVTPEGVRQVLLRAGVETRDRAAAGTIRREANAPEPRECPICGNDIESKTSKTCSVKCAAKMRTKGAPEWVELGMVYLSKGDSYSEAAAKARAELQVKDDIDEREAPWILSRWTKRLGKKVPPWKLECKGCQKKFTYPRTRKNKPLYCDKCRGEDRRKFTPATHFAPKGRNVGCMVTHREDRRLVKTADPSKVTCERCLLSDIYHEATASKPQVQA